MDSNSVRIGELLPHGPEMTLVDRLVSYTPTGSVIAADISERCVFFDRTGVPAWAGIEYMSQAVAAHAATRRDSAASRRLSASCSARALTRASSTSFRAAAR